VLSFVFERLANKEIAARIGVSEWLRQVPRDRSPDAQSIGAHRFGAIPGPDLVEGWPSPFAVLKAVDKRSSLNHLATLGIPVAERAAGRYRPWV